MNRVDTIEPADLINTNYTENMFNMVTEQKRRRSSSCSSSSSIASYSSSSSSSEDDDVEDFSSIRKDSMSSDSSSDSEEEIKVATPFLHRRQMEELLLDKITNHLDPEKLPGILTIISKTHEEEVEEVEIDLARLDRIQLDRILSYVNACIEEKQGGAAVKLSDYIIKPPAKQQTPPQVQQQQPKSKTKRIRKKGRNALIDQGHIVGGSTPSKLSSHGPISMSALTEMESKSSKSNARKRRAKKNKKDDDVSVHMSTNINLYKESIASTKPKRKSAVHKRRLLEEMLRPANGDSSDDEDDEQESGSGIIVFGDEQMDMAVTHNETISHQEQQISTVSELQFSVDLFVQSPLTSADEEEDDELIDIMI